MNLETARSQMLAQQVRAWDVLDQRVLDALNLVPREQFVPERYRDLAFADIEIPLGHGQQMLTPKVEGRLLQALRLAPIDEALVVGTGSGFLTACLARLAGRVVSVDIFADFIEAASERLADFGVHNVELTTTDAVSLSDAAGFDAIALSASLPEFDERFVRMLRPDGRLFVVVGRPPIMEARLITMRPGGQWTEESLFETLLTPMINAEQSEPFVL